METIFTKIIKREIPSYIVYEDDIVIAFLDIIQATKGHTLVITKNPYPDLFSVPEDELAHLIKVTKKLAKTIKSVFNADGVNLVNNNGASAGQIVFHYHVHIIPRYKEDNVKFNFPNNMESTSKDEFKKRAEAITSALL